MANKLLLDKSTLSDPDALANCKVGDTKQLTVTCTVTRDDADIFEADVSDIEYSDSGGDGYTEDQGQNPETVSPTPPTEAEKA